MPEEQPPALPTSAEWQPVELPGAVCADGSQYLFFVRFAGRSGDLAITLEPGGACWDYRTCSGQGGVLGAANLDGVEPSHMTALPPPYGDDEGGAPWGLLYPHLGESMRDVATADFHQVFFPYCTGDAFAGDLTLTYTDEASGESLTIEHRGRANLELAAEWLARTFSRVGRLHVSGASAGGLGSQLNYSLLRDALEPRCSSLINDSGLLFAPGGPQTAARAAFIERWQLEDLVAGLDARLAGGSARPLSEDLGFLSARLAETYPDDRLLAAFFARDLNFSLFSYEGFFEPLPTERVYELWDEDTELLLAELEPHPGWGWFVPGFRPDNCSHCVSLVPVDEIEQEEFVLDALRGSADGYLRTELDGLDFGDVLAQVVGHEGELPRLRDPAPAAEFTAEREAECRDLGD